MQQPQQLHHQQVMPPYRHVPHEAQGHVEHMDQDEQLVGNQLGDSQQEDTLVEAGTRVQTGTLDKEGMSLVVEGRPQAGSHEKLELPHEQCVRKILCHHDACPFHLPSFSNFE